MEDERCSVSTSWERRCQTDDAGALRCETIKRKFRHCPGRPAEELSAEHVEHGADDAESSSLLAHVPSALFGAFFGEPQLPPERATPGGFGHAVGQQHPGGDIGQHTGIGELGGLSGLSHLGGLLQQLQSMLGGGFGPPGAGAPRGPGNGADPGHPPPPRVRVEEV